MDSYRLEWGESYENAGSGDRHGPCGLQVLRTQAVGIITGQQTSRTGKWR